MSAQHHVPLGKAARPQTGSVSARAGTAHALLAWHAPDAQMHGSIPQEWLQPGGKYCYMVMDFAGAGYLHCSRVRHTG